MSTKSQSRRQRDAAQEQAVPGIRKVLDRKKSAQCWFELKVVHMRSQDYMTKVAGLFAKYRNPVVLAKIVRNGDFDKWQELHGQLPPIVERMSADFSKIWDMHKDKRKLCLSSEELTQAYRIFDLYQAFDMEFFELVSPIISGLNEIFNKALKMLLDAQEKLRVEMQEQAKAEAGDVTKVTDVSFTEEEKLPTLISDGESLVRPDPSLIPESLKQRHEQAHSNDGVVVDPNQGEQLIRPAL